MYTRYLLRKISDNQELLFSYTRILEDLEYDNSESDFPETHQKINHIKEKIKAHKLIDLDLRKKIENNKSDVYLSMLIIVIIVVYHAYKEYLLPRNLSINSAIVKYSSIKNISDKAYEFTPDSWFNVGIITTTITPDISRIEAIEYEVEASLHGPEKLKSGESAKVELSVRITNKSSILNNSTFTVSTILQPGSFLLDENVTGRRKSQQLTRNDPISWAWTISAPKNIDFTGELNQEIIADIYIQGYGGQEFNSPYTSLKMTLISSETKIYKINMYLLIFMIGIFIAGVIFYLWKNDFLISKNQYIENICKIKRRQLMILEEKKAKYGDLHCPPYILIEIEDLIRDLDELSQGLYT